METDMEHCWIAGINQPIPADEGAELHEGHCVRCTRSLTADDDDPEFCSVCQTETEAPHAR
jgi:hypothetical protein